MAKKYTVEELKKILKYVGGYRALNVKSEGHTRKQDLFDLLVSKKVIAKASFAIETPEDKGVHSEGVSSDETLILKYSPSIHESVKDRIKDAPDIREFPIAENFKTDVWDPWRQLRVEYELLMDASSEWGSSELKLLYYLNNPDVEVERGLLTTLYPFYPLTIYLFILDYTEMHKAAYLEDLRAPFIKSSVLPNKNLFKIAYIDYSHVGDYADRLSLPMLIYSKLETSIVTEENVVDLITRILSARLHASFLHVLLNKILESEIIAEAPKEVLARKTIRQIGTTKIHTSEVSSSLVLLIITEFPDYEIYPGSRVYIDSKTTNLLNTGRASYHLLHMGPSTELRDLDAFLQWREIIEGVYTKRILRNIVHRTQRFDVIVHAGLAHAANYKMMNPFEIALNREKCSFKDLLLVIEIEKEHGDALLAIANLALAYSPHKADEALKIIAPLIKERWQRESVNEGLDIRLEELDWFKFHVRLLIRAIIAGLGHQEKRLQDTRDAILSLSLEHVAKYIEEIPDNTIGKLLDYINIGDIRNPLIKKLWEREEWGVIRILEYYIKNENFQGIVYTLENNIRVEEINPLVMAATTSSIRALVVRLLTK